MGDWTPEQIAFLRDTHSIVQMHLRGNNDEWLPLILDAEGVHLGEPAGTVEAIAKQFGCKMVQIPTPEGTPLITELRAAGS